MENYSPHIISRGEVATCCPAHTDIHVRRDKVFEVISILEKDNYRLHVPALGYRTPIITKVQNHGFMVEINKKRKVQQVRDECTTPVKKRKYVKRQKLLKLLHRVRIKQDW